MLPLMYDSDEMRLTYSVCINLAMLVKQHREPAPSAGKRVQVSHDWFWFYIWARLFKSRLTLTRA